MTTNCFWKRTVRLFVVVFFLLGLIWLVMEARQWLFRLRAEALLADIKSLELNRSSWSDAQKLMTRWGRWGGWYGSCNSEDCSYSVQIYHLPLIYPAFVFEEGPHIGARILQLVGLRSAAVSARFHVVHGIVTNKGFGYSVALPVSQWITPGGGLWLKERIGSTYWPTLDVAFREAAKLGDSIPYSITMHPNHSLIHRRTILEVHFTPEDAPEEQAALMDMRFDCITRWTACSNRGELLPAAAAEEDTDSRQWKMAGAKTSPRSICPTIQFRAREEQDVLVAKIVSGQAATRPANTGLNSLDKWLTYARIEEVLKGGAHVGVGDVLLAPGPCETVSADDDSNLLVSIRTKGVFRYATGKWTLVAASPYPSGEGEYWTHLSASSTQLAIALDGKPVVDKEHSRGSQLHFIQNAPTSLWVLKDGSFSPVPF